MKMVAFAIDNFKIAKLKKELAARGFTQVKTFPITQTTSLVQITFTAEQNLLEIVKACETVKIHFSQSN